MLLFLDTEFTDFQNSSLISIGLVSDDGLFEFYAERTDFDYEACSPFVRSTVWAHLGLFPDRKFKKEALERELATALSGLAGPLAIAFDSTRDCELLMGIFERYPCPVISQYVDLRAMQCQSQYMQAEARFFSEDQPRHHALFDARANRAGWIAYSESARDSEPPATVRLEVDE